MGYRQHLVRSVLAIRDDGGVSLSSGDRITVEPILVGRNAEKLAGLAAEHGVTDFTTNLDEALSDSSAPVYFDAQVTSERKKSILKAIGAGKHIYTEKPIAESVDEGIELVTAVREARVINGVVHDKLYLPGRGWRRHGAGHVPALELRVGEPLREGAGVDCQGRYPHPGALGRTGSKVRGNGRRRRVRDLRARGRCHRTD